MVGGVAYAAMKPGASFDISDLWGTPALLALGSTVAFAIAKLLAKSLMNPTMKKERNLDPANNYAFLTCCSSSLLLLPSLLAEGRPALAGEGLRLEPTAPCTTPPAVTSPRCCSPPCDAFVWSC